MGGKGSLFASSNLPLLLVVLLYVFPQLVAAQNCGTYTASDGSRFDLSSLTKPEGYTTTVNTNNYAWNYCAPVPNLPNMPACTNTMALLVNGSGSAKNQKCYNIGSTLANPSYSISDGVNGPGSGVQITYKNEECTTVLRVNCNMNFEYLYKNVQATPATCNFVIIVQAKVGCKIGTPPAEPTHPKHGLSHGSVFLIVFFAVLASYFIFGALIKWKAMGATPGAELIPNSEFWASLPGLIGDGCRFSKDKALGLCGRSSYSSL